jgi:hypothetical protein
MMMACKGICLRHKAQKPVDHIGRYVIGQKRVKLVKHTFSGITFGALVVDTD